MVELRKNSKRLLLSRRTCFVKTKLHLKIHMVIQQNKWDIETYQSNILCKCTMIIVLAKHINARGNLASLGLRCPAWPPNSTFLIDLSRLPTLLLATPLSWLSLLHAFYGLRLRSMTIWLCVCGSRIPSLFGCNCDCRRRLASLTLPLRFTSGSSHFSQSSACYCVALPAFMHWNADVGLLSPPSCIGLWMLAHSSPPRSPPDPHPSTWLPRWRWDAGPIFSPFSPPCAFECLGLPLALFSPFLVNVTNFLPCIGDCPYKKQKV